MAVHSVTDVATWNTAAAAAVAGDVIEVAAGTYIKAGTASKNTPAFRTTNAGTAGNYIVIKAMGAVEFRAAVTDSGTASAATATTLTDSSKSWTVNQFRPAAAGDYSVKITACTGVPTAVGQYRYITSNTATALTLVEGWAVTPDNTATYEIRANGPMAGSLSNDYVYWTVNNIATDYYAINALFAPGHSDMGHVVLSGADGCVVEGFRITGSRAFYTDNYNGVRLEDCDSCTVKNNRISGIRHTTATNHNGAGIMTYSATNSTFEHNDITDCGVGINIKGETSLAQTGNTIRYNYIYSCEKGIRIDNSLGATQSYCYQNVIANLANTGYAINLGTDVRNWDIYNNTCYNASTGGGGYFINTGGARTNIQLRDNVFVGWTTAIDLGDVTTVSAADDYNYDHVQVGTRFGRFNGSNSAARSNFVTATGKETNGSDAAPGFTNTGSLPAGLAIAGGGAALTSSSTGGVSGAYITGTEEIGLQTTVDAVVVTATTQRINVTSIRRRREALH